MIARILADVRRLSRWAGLVRGGDIAAAEALFSGADVDPLMLVSSLNPSEVGRQAVSGEAIDDVVRWLNASGWYGEDAEGLRLYADYLLKARAAYERGAEVRP